MATQPDPLARFRLYSLWFAVLIATGNAFIILFDSPVSLAWRLAGLASIGALIVWWSRGYRAAEYRLDGLLAETVPLWVVGVATGGLLRAVGLFLAAYQLAGLYATRRHLVWSLAALGLARLAVYGFTDGAASIVSLPAIGSVLILTYVAITMHVVADGMMRHAASDVIVRASEERYRILQSVTTDVIYDWTIAADQVDWAGNLDVFGYAPGAATTFDWWMDRVHADDRARVTAALRAHENWTTAKPLCYRFRRANGTYAQIASTAAVQRDAGGPVRVVGALRDVWTV